MDGFRPSSLPFCLRQIYIMTYLYSNLCPKRLTACLLGLLLVEVWQASEACLEITWSTALSEEHLELMLACQEFFKPTTVMIAVVKTPGLDVQGQP